MYQFIQTLSLGAVLITLVVSLWQDWGTFTTLKRMLISYLMFFFVGALMSLAVKLVGVLENDPQPEAETPPTARPKARKT